MRKDIEHQLRDAAGRSGLNMFQLAKRADIRYSSIHNFMASGRSLDLRSAAKLCKLLDLELQAKKPKKVSRKRGA